MERADKFLCVGVIVDGDALVGAGAFGSYKVAIGQMAEQAGLPIDRICEGDRGIERLGGGANTFALCGLSHCWCFCRLRGSWFCLRCVVLGFRWDSVGCIGGWEAFMGEIEGGDCASGDEEATGRQ